MTVDYQASKKTGPPEAALRSRRGGAALSSSDRPTRPG
ncbi:hypothetical protein L553_2630 [Bordetella pertussis I036]|nr:hypothetical protein L553_2630 [Bordetella pertussis I036]